MAAPRFLLKTELARFAPLALDGRAVTAQHERLQALLAARGLAASGALFAEPISGAGAISWYGTGAGEPQPITALSAERRAEAEARLAAAIAPVLRLLDDPEAGPLLRRALVLGDAEQVLVLDDGIVLAGWGLVPAGIAGDADAARHAASTLGRFVPALSSIDASFLGPVEGPPQRQAAASPAAMPGAAMPAAPEARRGAGAQAAPAPATTEDAQRAWWMVPLLVAVALAFLLLGFWLAWHHFVRDIASRSYSATIVDADRTRLAIKLQRETNEALEREVERARRAAGQDVCRAEGPAGGALPALPQSQPVAPGAAPPCSWPCGTCACASVPYVSACTMGCRTRASAAMAAPAPAKDWLQGVTRIPSARELNVSQLGILRERRSVKTAIAQVRTTARVASIFPGTELSPPRLEVPLQFSTKKQDAAINRGLHRSRQQNGRHDRKTHDQNVFRDALPLFVLQQGRKQ